MKRSAIKRTAFKSAWVRHSPFPAPQKRLANRQAVSAEPSSGPVSGPILRQQSVRKPLKAIGKRGREWINARSWLKKRFNWAGIIYCEARLQGCHLDNMLSFAHCKKRREMLEGEIYHVALLCLHCHEIYERLSHEDMHARIHELIEKRGLIAPK